tara:strand:- start:358 stop:540 length:183 start_codon:yes stop_codon:yes gene_type:complete
MYITKDNKIIIELGGLSIDRETLDQMKIDYNKKTDQELENYLSSCADTLIQDKIEFSQSV